MRLKGGLIGAAAFIGLLAIGSRPQPAVAFACSTDQFCNGGQGCKTVLSASGLYEGVHICATGCAWPSCQKAFGMTTPAEVETLVQNTTNGDIKAAVRLVTKYRSSVRYNSDRHALMYYATCTGDVPIGVQPLSAGQSQAVAAAIAD